MALQEEALIESARVGDIDGVRAALAADADVHADDDFALRWAAGNGHSDVVRTLLAAGANVHADGDRALRWAATRGHAEVVHLLLAADADPLAVWANARRSERPYLAATLVACAGVLTPNQRTALAAESKQFSSLRRAARTRRVHQRLQR